MNSIPPIIFIVGPTAVGKSAVAFHLAKYLHTEIISCDAMQVYREINIASNKPSPEERFAVPHHLIDVVSVVDDYNVATYEAQARAVIDQFFAKGMLPLIVGGSGMYMKVLLDGIFKGESRSPDVRQALQREAEKEGWDVLYARLQALDAKAAEKIHPHDQRRLLRALEVCLTQGEPISALHQQRQGLWDAFEVKLYALDMDRAALYEKINARVDAMFERGLIDEVYAINQTGLSRTVRSLIGIPEIQGFLNGVYDEAHARYLMKRNTRHLAKKQMTWFRRETRLQWIPVGAGVSAEEIAKQIIDDCKGAGKNR